MNTLVHEIVEVMDSAEEVLVEHKEFLAEAGGCDHSVGICVCGIEAKVRRLEAALDKLKRRSKQWRLT